MGYEGESLDAAKPPEDTGKKEQTFEERMAEIDQALLEWKIFSEQRHNKELEEERGYPDPEIISEDSDTIGLRIPGATQPLYFGMHFTTVEDKERFLQSKMDAQALSANNGTCMYLRPYKDDLEHTSKPGWEKSREYSNDRGISGIAPSDLMEWYGLPYKQIRHAWRFAEWQLLNAFRARAGKPPLPRPAPTYVYTTPPQPQAPITDWPEF